MNNTKGNRWELCSTEVFWGEVAPTDHLVQVYENEEVLLDALEGFTESGFKAGDSVVMIATDAHLKVLNLRMTIQGYDLHALEQTKHYIPLNAAETLKKFMRVGWPDEKLFAQTVTEIVTLAQGEQNRNVRAYGEMVALLWEQGHSGATVRLEELWNKFCETENLCLFHAYPKIVFTRDVETSINHICSAHTKLINGVTHSKTKVFYQNL